MRAIPVIVLLALTVYALADCARAKDLEIKAAPKPIWLLLILIAPLVGPVAWLVSGKVRTDQPSRYDPRRSPAPDDNPAFLRKLGEDEWSRKRRLEREAKKQQAPQDAPTDASEGDTGATGPPQPV